MSMLSSVQYGSISGSLLVPVSFIFMVKAQRSSFWAEHALTKKALTQLKRHSQPAEHWAPRTG
jgi:hypothetical protein